MSATPDKALSHVEIPARPDLIRLLLGIIGIGSSGPLVALSAMPIPTLIFWRNLGGSILTAPFAIKHGTDRAGAKWSAIAGVLLSLHFMGFFYSMRMTSVAAGTALVALQPIFAAIFVTITGEEIPSKAWLGMGVSFIGVLVISGIDFSLDKKSFIGDIAAIVSGALSALYLMAGSRAQKTIETTSYTTICYFVCALTALPVAIISGFEILNFPLRQWVILLSLVLGAQILGHTMFNSTLRRVSPAIVSLIVFFEVPVAALVAGAFHIGKQPTLVILPGVALILLGCSMVVIRTRSQRAPLTID